ncbi:MAG TPA: glutamate--tRNA ligase [Jatrophihabitans sp.]|nr:glutamate--tRNA ligase [Jatrophihabitans sp.]
MTPDGSLRVRFCPSPTGNPHVGLIRTCLFNWAFARHHGGSFVFRIEDTDAARDSQESYEMLLDTLRWFGMDWDEGPEVGGPYGPYRQSERGAIYADVVRRLIESGHLYESFSTNEEIEARHRAASRDPKLGYDNYDRELTEQQRATLRDEGRAPVLRLRMPDEDLGWHDLVRGQISFAAGSVPDFVVVRANGDPLYTLVNPVDDAMMRITHVIRGEDLLPSTPRQIALYRALVEIGVARSVPEFGHLPYVMGEGNKKLSKRDPQASIYGYRDAGYLPEGMINYLALLGWSIAEDRDIFTPAELVAAFDGSRISLNPARFDGKKMLAINATHLRMLTADDFAARLTGFLARAGLIDQQPTERERELIAGAAPLIQERVQTLSEGVDMLRFLFVPDAELEMDEVAFGKQLGESGQPVLAAAIAVLEPVTDWRTEAIEAALRIELIERMQLKPRNAFGPLRVAVTGRQVSPPLFESMELLGRAASLARMRAATR